MLRRSSFLLFVGLSAFWLLSAAPDAVAAEPGTVTMTLTAVKKDAEPPAVKREDVQLYVNKDRTQIADWQRGENFLRPSLGVLVVVAVDDLNRRDMLVFVLEECAI